MAKRTLGKLALRAAWLAFAALVAGAAIVPSEARILSAFERTQARGQDEHNDQEPPLAAPEAEQRDPHDGASSEDGTREPQDRTEPESPPGCNFNDGRPLELLV